MKIIDVSRHCLDYNTAKDFLRSRCVIRRDIPRCKKCDGLMTEVKTGRGDELIWRCPIHKTNKLSFRDGSFLHLQKISLQDFIMMVYFWAHETPVSTTEVLVELSQPTVSQWYSYLRDICSDHLAITTMTTTTTKDIKKGAGEEGEENLAGDQLEHIDVSTIKRRKIHHKDESTWRHHYGKTHGDAFENVLLHISQLYVTP